MVHGLCDTEVVWYRGCVVQRYRGCVASQRLCGTGRISAGYVTVTAPGTASQCRNPPLCFLTLALLFL